MAGEKLGYTYTARAAADHQGLEGIAVVINGGAEGIPQVEVAGAGVAIDGVILRGEKAGEVERIGKEGVIMMITGAAIVAAGEVEIDADGKVITKASGVAIGECFAAASSGDMIPIMLK
jgi:hypothetical protein